jgi:hypothetical protein
LNANLPRREYFFWEIPEHVFDRVHIDFAGPIRGRYLFVFADAKSHWLEARWTTGLTAVHAIKALLSIFASHGIPLSIVSDNGPAFIAREFNEFCAAHGIDHIFSPDYHPESNGLAERAVQFFKNKLDKHERGDLDIMLPCIMAQQHVTPHASLQGLSPADVFVSRKVRGPFENLLSLNSHASEAEVNPKFAVGNRVIVYLRGSRKEFALGTVTGIIGRGVYEVFRDDGVTIRRHQNHIRVYKSRDGEEQRVRVPEFIIPFLGRNNNASTVTAPIVAQDEPIDGAVAQPDPGESLRNENACRCVGIPVIIEYRDRYTNISLKLNSSMENCI